MTECPQKSILTPGTRVLVEFRSARVTFNRRTGQYEHQDEHALGTVRCTTSAGIELTDIYGGAQDVFLPWHSVYEVTRSTTRGEDAA